MNKNAFLLLLLILPCCGIVPSEKKTNNDQSGNQDDIRYEKLMEEKLVASVGSYIKRNGPEDTTGSGKLLNTSFRRPVIAVTKEEMKRLKKAWAGKAKEHEVLARRFARADAAIAEGLTFPPQGGQHNQWYQCDSCQRGLVTIDAHHHQCPICKKIYSGFPYDNVLYNRKHSQNLRSAEDAAWAWAITGEKKYAAYAAAVLTGYADRYLGYRMISASVNDSTIDIAAGKNGKYRSAGHMQAQTLDEASSLIPATVTYDLIYNSGSLSDQQKLHVENDFLRAMAGCVNVYKAGKSNWQTWHNAALLYTGAVTGDGKMIRQALLDDKNGFTAQMKISVMPEGMWYENSWGYHYYTLSAMTLIAEGSRRLGFDVYNFPSLRKMYLIAFDYLMADGSLPRFGDAVQDSPSSQGVNEKAYAVYRDDRLLQALSTQTSWDAIISGRDMSGKSVMQPPSGKLITGAGHGILATNGPGKLTAAITFGPFGGFHGHYDKLSFMLFGFGHELGVDPGRAASQAYRLPIHREWYKSTTGHNIVLADGKSQKEAEGKCLAFSSNTAFGAITAEAGPAFENILHTRFLLLSPDYLLIIDELKASDGKEHTFDWLYHNKGQSVSCNLPPEGILPGNTPEGYAYLKDISGYRAENDRLFSVNFSGREASLNLIMEGQAGDNVFTATGPHTNVEDRVPMVIVRRKGNFVRYAAVLEPAGNDGKYKINALKMDSEDSSMTATITYEGGEDRIIFPQKKLDNFTVQQGSKTVLNSTHL